MSRNCSYYSAIRKGPRIPPLSPELKAVYRIISKTIMSWGFDVFVTDSAKTRSRYLTIPIHEGRKIKIRLSDHPPKWRGDTDFDVYTREPRRLALECYELLDVLEKRLKVQPCTEKEHTKLYKSGNPNER